MRKRQKDAILISFFKEKENTKNWPVHYFSYQG
jgi:hypothetical protein